ncbi:dynamin family protein [Paenibacillus sp. MMS20-IR301]|uniref:dynamin family protein n=1 Tax=Paenibacillus sp. MMS20-IR301 TaxID=2895946 RepID=UPI0028E3D833|nr:dynamin family protein [Paenibacillus sp. MMS20-IR301]WNS41537.1 dynamin family protein [Paenibacillus sp. MMS20-IR301]
MKKVFVKYNPYKLETEITVDGKGLAQNSKLGEKAADGSRLQEWVEELPRILVEEYNDTNFEITFHGTLLDYEDLVDVFTEAHKNNKLKATIKRNPAKETADKEALINDVFNQIQQGPFNELKDAEIVSAFEHAKSSDFEVCVVATMSAGKSTLINSMLGSKLMPSKQEACTAIVTRIKDTTRDEVPFIAEVYNQEDELTETHAKLTYPIMERLNSSENISAIHVSGNIPFVSSEDVSLVLIDTPGPNNSRDPRHRKVQSELLGKSSKALVLYIMTGEFGTDDDNALLNRVAESMSVGGKQSKDRFIFVVNKLDDRKKEDGDTSQTLERVRSYLKNHGIVSPNLFPASALPALNIRLMASEADVDVDTIDETEMKIKKLNRNEPLHFETYAALPPSIRGEINEQLAATREAWSGRDNENPEEALIHTGVVSIEAAIRQYVQKYAKTAKIKNIVDTFLHKLDEVGAFEETKRELARNQEESKRIVRLIESIREKMDDARDAKKFKDSVDDAVVAVNDSSREVVEGILEKFQARITKRIDDLRNQELSIHDAEEEAERLHKFAQKLEPDFEVELDELVRNNIVGTGVALLEAYKKKLASLTEELDIAEVTIDPLKLMGGSVGEFSAQSLIKKKDVEDGEEWVKNTDKRWFKPWTWGQESGYYRTTYKTVQYVLGAELAQKFFAPVEDSLYNNGDNARKYALQQSKRIADRFNKEFERLDDVLKVKLAELENYATDKKKADERVLESERKLNWLEQIKVRVESIMEI